MKNNKTRNKKMRNNKTKNNKTKNNKTKTWGGKNRTEVIEYTVSSGHLDNNLHSKFRIKKGAKYDKSESCYMFQKLPGIMYCYKTMSVCL